MPTKSTSRSRSTESDQGPSKKAKKPSKKIHKKPMNKLSLKEYAALRGINPYTTPKDVRACPNPKFYTNDQERIYNEVYGPKKQRFCDMHWINIDHLDENPTYFGEAKAICEEFGLLPLMEFTQFFDEDLVAQFFATVKMTESEEGARSL